MAFTTGSTVMYDPKGDPEYYRQHVGTYNRSLSQEVLEKWLQNASSNLPEQDCITVCEYGTADGSTSSVLMRRLIRTIRETYGDKKQVHIIYEDQPKNNFQSIFLRAHGLMEGYDKEYLKEDPNVFVTVCGTSFYLQCLPDNTVSIGMCTIATHYLSHRPCKLQNALWSRSGGDPDGNALFAKAAARDLDVFIQMRAKELISGGWLATSNMLYNDESKPFTQAFFHVAKRMADENLITKEEMEEMTPAVYIRTEEEFLSAFQGEDSIAKKCGLELVSHTTELTENPILTRWKLRKTEDPKAAAEEYGKGMAAFFKGVGYNTFGLVLASRGEEADALVDMYFSRLAETFASSPEDLTFNPLVLHLLLRKQ